MPASTGTHCKRCTSHRGVMVDSCGTVLVVLASWRAALSPSARGPCGVSAIVELPVSSRGMKCKKLPRAALQRYGYTQYITSGVCVASLEPTADRGSAIRRCFLDGVAGRVLPRIPRGYCTLDGTVLELRLRPRESSAHRCGIGTKGLRLCAPCPRRD